MNLKTTLHQTLSYIKEHTVHFVVAIGYSSLEYWLGKTKKLVANSTGELLFTLVKRLFTKTKDDKTMALSKVLVAGPHGNVEVSEVGGKVMLTGTLSASLGGGGAEGVMGVSGNVSLTLEAKQLIDLGFELAKAKFPGAGALLDAAKGAVDSELAKA